MSWYCRKREIPERARTRRTRRHLTMRERSYTAEGSERPGRPAACPGESRDGAQTASGTHGPAPSGPAGGGGAAAATPQPLRVALTFRCLRELPLPAPGPTEPPVRPPAAEAPGPAPGKAASPPGPGRGLAGRSRPAARPRSADLPPPLPPRAAPGAPTAVPFSSQAEGSTKIKKKPERGSSPGAHLVDAFERHCVRVPPPPGPSVRRGDSALRSEGGREGGREQARRRGKEGGEGEGATALLLPPETAEGGARAEWCGQRNGQRSARRAAAVTAGRRKGVWGKAERRRPPGRQDE